MMAARTNPTGQMLVGSKPELGWSSTTLQGPRAFLVATGVSALQGSCPVAPTHAGNNLSGGDGCRRPNRCRPTPQPVSRSSSLAEGSSATAARPAHAHVVSLHPPAQACQSCLSGLMQGNGVSRKPAAHSGQVRLGSSLSAQPSSLASRAVSGARRRRCTPSESGH
jgi:hypothetical protein